MSYTLLTLFTDDRSQSFWKRLGIILTDVNQKPKVVKHVEKVDDTCINENENEKDNVCWEMEDDEECSMVEIKPPVPAKILTIPDLDSYGNAKMCRKKGLVKQPEQTELTENGVKPNMNAIFDKARYDALVDIVVHELKDFSELDNYFVDKNKFFSTFNQMLKSPEFYQDLGKTFISSPTKFLGAIGKMAKTMDDVLIKPLQNFVWYFNKEFLNMLNDNKFSSYVWNRHENNDDMMRHVLNGTKMLVFHSDTYSVWVVDMASHNSVDSVDSVDSVSKRKLSGSELAEYMTCEHFKLDEFYTITVDDIYRMLFNNKYDEFRTASLSLYVTQPSFKCMLGKYKLDEELNEDNVDELRLENMSDGMISDYSSMDGLVKKVLMMANYYGTIGNVHLTTVWMTFYDLENILPSVYYSQFDWTEITSNQFLEYATENVMFRKYLR